VARLRPLRDPVLGALEAELHARLRILPQRVVAAHRLEEPAAAGEPRAGGDDPEAGPGLAAPPARAGAHSHGARARAWAGRWDGVVEGVWGGWDRGGAGDGGEPETRSGPACPARPRPFSCASSCPCGGCRSAASPRIPSAGTASRRRTGLRGRRSRLPERAS